MTCDKTAGFYRLTPGINRYGNHVHIDLGELVDLPGGLDGEMDVEGLHLDGDWFWVAGWRSLKRGKPDPKVTPGEDLAAMAKIKWDPNRTFIARIPLIE